ncbi:MAG: phosphatidate cytidylyltransferase [Alphaproteobacteria bacterium]
MTKQTLTINKKNLWQRLISGGLLGAIAFGFIFLPIWLQLIGLFFVIFLAHREWQKLAHHTARPLLWFMVGFFYILAAAIAAIYLLIHLPIWFWQTLLVVVMADIGGYIFGKIWGRHKLAEKISPKKTWEGVIGGILFATITIYISAITFHKMLGDYLWGSIAISWLMVIASIGGDLFESYFKRCAAVKDSGHILPGHGGLLDRIDGQLMALIWIGMMVYLKLLG